MAFGEIFVVLFMLLGGMGGNEALDFVATDQYWRVQGKQPAEEQLIEQISKPEVKEGAPAKAAEIRKLMVIRTLGELKSEKALPALEEASNSKEPFVADYAKEAIAAIKGEAYIAPAVEGNDVKDMNIMPKEAGVFVHAKMRAGPPVDILKEMKKTIPEEHQKGMEEGVIEMQTSMVNFLEKSGNIRIDSISFSVAEMVGDEEGWVVISFRGSYDHVALEAAIKEMAGDEFNKVKLGGLDFYELEEEVLFSMASDQQLVFIAGAKRESLPLEAVGKRVSEGAKDSILSKELQDLIGKTEKNGDLWASLLVTGKMKEVPHLQAFKTLRLETAKEKDLTEILLIGEGEDGSKVQQAIAALEEMHAGFVDKQIPEMKLAMPEASKPLTDFFEGIEFRSNGDLAIVRGKIGAFNPLAFISGYFMMSVRGMEFEPGE